MAPHVGRFHSPVGWSMQDRGAPNAKLWLPHMLREVREREVGATVAFNVSTGQIDNSGIGV